LGITCSVGFDGLGGSCGPLGRGELCAPAGARQFRLPGKEPGRGEAECQFQSGRNETLKITTENWDSIFQINKYANTTIRPASDQELYGVPDYWTYPTTAGDCEDYVLLKKRLLVGLGFNPQDLLITVVLDENREGHAVLTIPTNRGDFILDNRRTEILRWDQTGYIYLKRQSQGAAHDWVSLQKAAPQVLVSTKAN